MNRFTTHLVQRAESKIRGQRPTLAERPLVAGLLFIHGRPRPFPMQKTAIVSGYNSRLNLGR